MRLTRRPAAGQALVEFALVITIFVVVLMILFDFGRVVYTQHTITQAAREGARAGEVSQQYTQAKYDEIRAHARASAVAVGLNSADISGADGPCPIVDTTSPTTCFYPDGLAAGSDRVVVRISISIDLITPGVALVLGNSFTLTAESVGYLQCNGCQNVAPTAPPVP